MLMHEKTCVIPILCIFKTTINSYQTVNMLLSCATQLTTDVNDCAKILDNKGWVDTFILDFEKALDTPSHELLKGDILKF